MIGELRDWVSTGLLAAVVVSVSAAPSCGAEPTLPGTSVLTLTQPLDEVMVDGINRFCLQKLVNSRDRRGELWLRDYASVETYTASIAANRNRFREIIGVVDPRVSPDPQRSSFELLSTLERSSVLARTDSVTVHAVRWQVLNGVTAEGLLLEPKRICAGVVAVPDADWTPEMFCGIAEGLPENAQFARLLAEAGCLVAIPTLISRSSEHSGHPAVGYTNQTHREFLYRQAFEMGRHPIGLEVQKVLAAVDLFEQMKSSAFPVGVAGVGEGGLVAFYAAAIDSRIDSTLVCGYFQGREGLWKEPIYRNVWRLLTEFGDAEIASLIAPRRLVIEACGVDEVAGPPAVRTGRRNAAAPGKIQNIALNQVQLEFQYARSTYRRLGRQSEIVLVVSGQEGSASAGSSRAVAKFAAGLGIKSKFDGTPTEWKLETVQITEASRIANLRKREKRQFEELQVFVQNLLRRSANVRDDVWKSDLSSVESWLPSRNRLRDRVHDELIGRLHDRRLSPNPRTRLVLETDAYRGYEVVLDVVPDVIAAGVLLLPDNLKADEQRPVVVCQHGLERTAMDTISREPVAFRSYKAFADELCRQGFIVYSPQNPYRGGDRFRSIQRKANPLGLSLFSFIIAQHEQTLDWLAALPQVDAERIAFYGLSYGGKTAMRVPPFVDRYCLSICSGDFTDWVRTITTNEERYGYIFTGEYEIPEWNMGHVASYAELAMLMSPRPFMVEQGHRDGGAPTEWVLGEYGKVRRHYDQLKIGDQTEIEFFDGPHTINGKGTFRFLHRHLNWPE